MGGSSRHRERLRRDPPAGGQVEGVYQGQGALESVQSLLLPMKFADIRTTHGLTKQVPARRTMIPKRVG